MTRPPNASQPLCLTVFSQAAARCGNGDDDNEGVLPTSLRVDSWDVYAGSNDIPQTPRISSFLDFDEGAHMNSSDFDDLDLDDLEYDTASTQDASGSDSDSGDEGTTAMPPPQDISMPPPGWVKTGTDRTPQLQPRGVLSHTMSSFLELPQLGPTIPE